MCSDISFKILFDLAVAFVGLTTVWEFEGDSLYKVKVRLAGCCMQHTPRGFVPLIHLANLGG